MSLMTGKANTSTVFHELFHHIATDLPESQLDAFNRHFNYDPLNPVKFQEDMAEAFEEFMSGEMVRQEVPTPLRASSAEMHAQRMNVH
ncbi:MAG TPA: hypothetical protein VK171_15885 [Fimbriimonas sp.]|nr:hypothetical protein [Fimbriimonas sp.]